MKSKYHVVPQAIATKKSAKAEVSDTEFRRRLKNISEWKKEAPCPRSLTMTVTLEHEPEVELLLEKRARAEGCDVKDYVEKLVERDVHRAPTFDEILAPFRDAVERSGISDEELGTLFTAIGEKSRYRTESGSDRMLTFNSGLLTFAFRPCKLSLASGRYRSRFCNKAARHAPANRDG